MNTVINFPGLGKSLTVRDERPLDISTGPHVRTSVVTHRVIQWSQLCAQMEKPTVTRETFAEYVKMPKGEQSRVKDVGYFIGAVFHGGIRKLDHWQHADLLQLDVDHADADTLLDASLLWNFSWACFSTHKHHPDKPRLRFVIPFSKRVDDADAYQAIGRKVAECLGIERFDDTTFENSRPMFWPSKPADGEFVFEVNDGPWLDVDQWLGLYGGTWQDHTKWPVSVRQGAVLKRHARRAGNPLEKPGLIGAFCRAYTISGVISRFLSDKFVSSDGERFTYAGGTTANGAVVYEEKWLYSHHSTDPGCNQLLNAFDLVRVHKFGTLDNDPGDRDEGEPVEIDKLASHKAMLELAQTDPDTKAEAVRFLLDRARADFSDIEDVEWRKKLDLQGTLIRPTINNILLFVEHDPELRGKVAYNLFTQQLAVRADLPWRKASGSVNGDQWTDADDACLKLWLARTCGVEAAVATIFQAMQTLEHRLCFDPVALYLAELSWDGIPRLDTLLIRHMGADDTAYTRAVTRKFLTAAVARVFTPGVKADHMLVLKGPQGLGKSAFFAILCRHREWFGDQPPPIEKQRDLQEWLRGLWVAEFSELASFTGKEMEHVRQFISGQVDRYRDAYGRRTRSWPRRCVLGGTTNDQTPLRDTAGNRRFWPVSVRAKLNFTALADEMDQVWAEALMRYTAGETMELDTTETIAEAEAIQIASLEDDGLSGLLESFVAEQVPASYYDTVSLAAGDFTGPNEAMVQRQWLIPLEIFERVLGGRREAYNKVHAYRITRAIRKIGGWSAESALIRTGARFGRQRVFVKDEKTLTDAELKSLL